MVALTVQFAGDGVGEVDPQDGPLPPPSPLAPHHGGQTAQVVDHPHSPCSFSLSSPLKTCHTGRNRRSWTGLLTSYHTIAPRGFHNYVIKVNQKTASTPKDSSMQLILKFVFLAGFFSWQRRRGWWCLLDPNWCSLPPLLFLFSGEFQSLLRGQIPMGAA